MTFTHGNPSRAPELRWRRTIDRRGRPTRLTVRRLLRDFGFAGLGPESQATIESRLAEVGVTVNPPLSRAEPDTIITLDAAEGESGLAAAAAPGPPAGEGTPVQAQVPAPAPPVQAAAPVRPEPPGGVDRVTQSALRAAKSAAHRLAELERALHREQTEKEAALRRIEELEAEVRRVNDLEAEVRRLSEIETEVRGLERDASEPVPEPPAPAAEARSVTAAPPAPHSSEAPGAEAAPTPAQPAIEVAEESRPAEPRQMSRSIGPLRVSRRRPRPTAEPEAAQDSEPDGKRRRLSRRSRQVRCVSCGQAEEARSAREAEARGWIVMGNKALCPTCMADGWRLTPRTRLPYRLTAPELEG